MSGLLRQRVRALKKGSAFAFFWGGGVLFSSLVLPAVALAPSDPRRARRRLQGVVQRAFVAFHDYMRVMGLIDYDPRQTRLDLPEGPFVMVANHPTLIDVTAVMSACGELSCVVKEEHYDGPMVGKLLRLCGHINGGDGSPVAGGAVVHQALDRIAEGQPVLIFPEGTRSPVGELGSFFRGAFEIARRAEVPVVPVLITCSPPTLMKGEKWFELPPEMSRLEVRPLPPLTAEELAGKSKAAAARVEARYREVLEAFWAERGGALPRGAS